MTATYKGHKVGKPGLYPNITHEEYLADPVKGGSLTRSALTWLLPPSTPARFRYLSEHPPPARHVLEVGSAAHQVALSGDASMIVEVKADNWRKGEHQEARKEARAAGKIPLLSHDVTKVKEMVEPLMSHPLAGILFDPDLGGRPEVTAAIPLEQWGTWARCRFDWLPETRGDGRLIIPDYKTADTADPTAWGRKAADYGYHRQASWYSQIARTLGLADEVTFVFVVQEKDPPYQVNVMQWDMTAMRVARQQIMQALDLFAQCRDTGVWPSYPAEIHTVSLPPWVENAWAAELTGGEL